MARPVRRALLSVYRKDGIVELGRGLAERGVTILSTGGTAARLREAGLEIVDVASITGFEKTLGGRVKTLHPAIFGGILARRDVPDDVASVEELGAGAIDLVVVDLYPFEDAAAAAAPLPDLIEKIDVGGPSMARAAAKNWRDVGVVVRSTRYESILTELDTHGGLTDALRHELAVEAFERTAAYDALIATTLAERRREATDGDADEKTDAGGARWPDRLELPSELIRGVRYGENPHQAAAVYALEPIRAGDAARRAPPPGILDATTLAGGAELSYNNLLDADAALRFARDLARASRLIDPDDHGSTVAVVMKHASPCGAAVAGSPGEAFDAAWSGDPLAAFGSVVALTSAVDLATARDHLGAPNRFVEVICAPRFEPDAEAWLRSEASFRRRVRLLELPSLADVAAPDHDAPPPVEVRSLGRALLVQEIDETIDDPATAEVVTARAPTDAERRDLALASVCAKHARSNAISLVKDGVLVGVCGGSVSRVEAVERAVAKAGDRARGASLGSDAFFPFADGVETATAAGVAAIVQPGGSKRDADSIAAADRAGATMVVTGARHFRH